MIHSAAPAAMPSKRYRPCQPSAARHNENCWSKAVVEKIFAGGDPDIFAKGHYGPGLPGWSYRSYFWVHPAEGVIMWKGLFGQGMYVNPRAEVVIARNCSHWNPSNSALDATSLPAYAAVVDHLTKAK